MGDYPPFLGIYPLYKGGYPGWGGGYGSVTTPTRRGVEALLIGCHYDRCYLDTL